MSFERLAPEERTRRLERYLAAVRRERWLPRVVFWPGFVVALGLTVSALFTGWPVWTIAVSPVVLVVPGIALYAYTARRTHAELINLDIRCPHCRKPLHTRGLSRFAAEDELRAVAARFCPRCFGPLPTVAELPDAVLDKLPGEARDQLGV